jgi:hypothetical protein
MADEQTEVSGMRNSFEMWLDTMKRYVTTIENHEQLAPETTKFVFEHALAHLVLGYRMATEARQRRKSDEGLSSSTDARISSQARANKEGLERVAKAEAEVPWWRAEDRFEKFVRYLAQVLGVSTAAPYETIYGKLVAVAVAHEGDVQEDEGRLRTWKSFGPRVWDFVSSRGVDAAHLAEAVARFVGSDLKNIDVRVDVFIPSVERNLSVLLGDVEKSLRDWGFVPMKIVPEPDADSTSPIYEEQEVRVPVEVRPIKSAGKRGGRGKSKA